MQFVVMACAQWYSEFVANFPTYGSGLGKPQMMSLTGFSFTDQTGLRCDELQMVGISDAFRFS